MSQILSGKTEENNGKAQSEYQCYNQDLNRASPELNQG
jgi:hypothetical protein